jgi:hypothetical protein
MVTTHSLFPPNHTVGQKVMEREWEGDINQMDAVSDDAKDLIAIILNHEPDNRPSAARILEHRWFDQDEAPASIAGGAIGRFDFDDDSGDERDRGD